MEELLAGWLVNPVVLASARAHIHKFNAPISSSFDFHSMIVENILHFTCQYSTMETTNLFLTDIKSVCAAWSTVFYYSFFRLGQPTAKTIPSPLCWSSGSVWFSRSGCCRLTQYCLIKPIASSPILISQSVLCQHTNDTHTIFLFLQALDTAA